MKRVKSNRVNAYNVLVGLKASRYRALDKILNPIGYFRLDAFEEMQYEVEKEAFAEGGTRALLKLKTKQEGKQCQGKRKRVISQPS